MFSNQSHRAMSEGCMREDASSPKSHFTPTHEFGTPPKCFHIGALSKSGLFFEEED